MKNYAWVSRILIIIIWVISGEVYARDRDVITVYPTKKFTNNWGAGPVIKKMFEREYNAEIKFIAFDSPNSILSRLKFEKENTKADILMGLDLAQLSSKEIKDLVSEHEMNVQKLDNLPIKWEDKFLIPYDYGFVTFIYRDGSLKKIPQSFKELIESKENFKIAISNPRSSNIGFDLLLWTAYVFGDDFEEEWKKFHEKITIFAKNWSDSWNLCMLGEVDMVLSYDTSAGYHKSQGEERLFKSTNFEEGHMIQLQLAAKIKKSANRKMVQNFFDFIFRPEIQVIISKHNFVHPVVKLKNDILYDNKFAGEDKRKILFDPTNKFSDRSELTKRWVKALI